MPGAWTGAGEEAGEGQKAALKDGPRPISTNGTQCPPQRSSMNIGVDPKEPRKNVALTQVFPTWIERQVI